MLTGEIDTTSSTGRLVSGICATLVDIERDLIHERTIAALAAARARRRMSGRPRMMTRAKLKTAMTMMADRENAARDVAEQRGVSISTLCTYATDVRSRASQLLSPKVARLTQAEHTRA